MIIWAVKPNRLAHGALYGRLALILEPAQSLHMCKRKSIDDELNE